MLSINSNIPSMIAQENLTGSGSALTQAITRLSSGKRINSAADDAAGLAISTTLQTSINGLTQGVSNANDAVSMVETASTGLTQITQSLQTIRSLAGEAAGGTLAPSDQQALQQDVAQQIQEVNRIASQTSYNGLNLLDGTAGVINVQVGAAVGQTVSLDLSQGLSAESLGGGYVEAGNTVGTLSGLNLNSDGSENTSGTPGAITSINVVANGEGGFSYTDQNGAVISSGTAANLFTTTTTNGIASVSLSTAANNGLNQANEMTSIQSAATTVTTAGAVLGTISGISVDPTTGLDVASTGIANIITSVTVEANGQGGFTLLDQNGQQLSSAATAGLFAITNGSLTGTTATPGTIGFSATPPTSTFDGAVDTAGASTTPTTAADAGGLVSTMGQININNAPTSVSAVNVSTTAGATLAMEIVQNALATVSNLQASLGAAQNRFTGIATSQQDESTDLSSAQSQITDADFATETANLSSAQVLQQAGISVLAQANSLPQSVLKLLQ
jgi:flagellin